MVSIHKPSDAEVRRAFYRIPKPIRWPIHKLWHVWLHLLASRTWVRDFALPVAVTILARLAVLGLVQHKVVALGRSPFSEVVFDVAVLLATMGFARWSITMGLAAMMAHVRDIASRTQSPRRQILRDFATAQVKGTKDIVEGLTGAGYPLVNPAAMKPWFARFFASGGSTYVGVDGSRPAQYIAQYRWFLDTHAESLEERRHPKTDHRVLAIPRADLSRDWRYSRPDYQAFFRWHPDHNVAISWIDRPVANGLRAAYGIGDADVALWEHFAVLFEPDNRTGTMRLGMWFPGEGNREGTTYEKISEYVEKVLDEATPLQEVAPGLDLVDRELAREWINYVDPAERARTVGPFLSKALGRRRSVFDAAAGIGCDSVYLLAMKTFQVFTNEVDELLLEQARAYAESQNAPLNFMSVLWEDLPQGLRGGLRFDAVLCLGNSLCLVDDANARLQCLRAFRECLLEDGLLIIDERNFQLMLDQERSINRDPMSFPTTTKPDVMYRGERIRGYPSHVDRISRIVNWRFVRNVPPIVERAQLDDARLPGSDLVLHAFAHGELFALLRLTGFEAIDVYADLQLVQSDAHTMPDYADVGDAGFLTYVGRKSRMTPAVRLDPAEGETPVAPGA